MEITNEMINSLTREKNNLLNYLSTTQKDNMLASKYIKGQLIAVKAKEGFSAKKFTYCWSFQLYFFSYKL